MTIRSTANVLEYIRSEQYYMQNVENSDSAI